LRFADLSSQEEEDANRYKRRRTDDPLEPSTPVRVPKTVEVPPSPVAEVAPLRFDSSLHSIPNPDVEMNFDL